MPFQQPDSPYASPTSYYPVHVPAVKRPKAKPDRTVAPRKAQSALVRLANDVDARLQVEAPSVWASTQDGPTPSPAALLAEFRAMPEALALYVQLWTAVRTRHSWVDADGMRHTAPSDPYSDLASAMPRKVWLLVNGKPAKAKPLSGTHGKVLRRSNWTSDGIVSVEVLLRGVLSNLRRQERRNGGETFKVESSATSKAQTAAIQQAREQEARDRRTVAEHRISLREQMLALRAVVSPTLLETLLDAYASSGAKSNALTIAICRIRASAKELATAPMAD